MYPQAFGKYVLEGELARGGMARVMLATLRGAGGFEKKLVVKQIRDELASDESFVKRFVEEAKTTVALSHPNIVPVYELGVEQGTYFLAMELVVGVSVHELLSSGALTPEQGAYVGVEVCRALDYAHRRVQVVHRDITPRNVMIDEEGQVKLIDFGIASLARVDAKHQVFGSPGHMPMEQMQGLPVGPAADLVALGALLMEAWSGRAPFRRKTQEEVEAALRAPRPKASDSNPRLVPLDEIMQRTLSNDPTERPQDAEELGRVLRRFLQGVDLGDVARELGERVRERRLREKKKEAPPASTKPGLQRPPSRGEMITKTFALRNEAKGWSERPPPSRDEPSTRKITDSGRPEKIETVATRPIETPVEPTPRQSEAPAPSKAWRWAAALGVAALIGGGALWLRRDSGSQATPAVSTASTGPSTTTSASAGTSTSASTTTSTSGGGVAPAISTSAEVKASGHLALYGDPGTRALVDGTARGPCPIADLTVEPGDHDVRFVFDATGESSGTRVTVKAGQHLKLRADFTGATPTVRVQR